MPTVFITGANSGLGLEFARQYAEAGWEVIATCRNVTPEDDLADVGARIMKMDVSNPDTVTKVQAELAGQSIDVLINNAGQMGDNTKSALTAPLEDWTTVFRVNVLGPAIVTRALVPNLRSAPKPVGATLGSYAGIYPLMTAPGNVMYQSTKAAAHAVTKSLGAELATMDISYFSLRPGPTKTRMLPGGEFETSDSVRLMRDVISGASIEWAGQFIDRSGEAISYEDGRIGIEEGAN